MALKNFFLQSFNISCRKCALTDKTKAHKLQVLPFSSQLFSLLCHASFYTTEFGESSVFNFRLELMNFVKIKKQSLCRVYALLSGA